MTESVFYESGPHRIEVRHIQGPWLGFSGWLWFRGVDNDVSYDGPLEYHGLHGSLDECLENASGELQVTGWVVSKDQRTKVGVAP